MKKTLIILTALLATAALTVAIAGEGQTKAYFDIENCAFCKNLGAEEGLLENTKWESHKIANGQLSVMEIPAEYQEAMQRAHEKMLKVAAEMQETGEQKPMCGFCTQYGGLMMGGAKNEEIKTMVGQINLLTSDDPAMVAKIHAFTDRVNEEYAKWRKEHVHHGGS